MEHPPKVKPFLLPVLVFLLILFLGTGILLLKHGPVKAAALKPQAQETESVKGILPPLNLPDEKRNAPGTDRWEFAGEIGSNFVSARTKLTAELMHQGWRPDRQITLDDRLSPRILLTFRKDTLELVLMLWKIDTGTTGFTYKREKITNPGVNVQ